MDLNFADLKKEAAATGGDLLAGGQQDDNAHTEHYFANEQMAKKSLDLENVEAFVQSMSANAKEAQEQLDAKFAQQANQFDNFLTQKTSDLGAFGTTQQQQAKQALANVSNDFMNAERGFFSGAADVTKTPGKTLLDDDLLSLGIGDGPVYAPTALLATAVPASNFYVDDDDEENFKNPSFIAKSSAAASSTDDSPSVSYNPSPVKKNPVTDALKEQDNDKFISSEDLLGEFKVEERTATPEFKTATTTIKTDYNIGANITPIASTVVTTDLDADDDGFFAATKPSAHTETVSFSEAFPGQEQIVCGRKATKAPQPAPVTQNVQKQERKQETTLIHEIFHKYGLDAWFKPESLHPHVESLIYWRDVKKSGIVFGAGLITLLAVSCFSVISVFAYLSLLTLGGTIAFRIYKSVLQAVQKTPEGHPFKEYLEIDLTLSQEKIQSIAGVAVAHINGFTAELRRLFLVENLVDSIKFGVILWVLTYIGAWFNGMTLVLLAFVSLFTLPKVYENNKQSIDTYLDLARSKLTEITDKIKVAIPIGNKPAVAAETDKDK